MTKQKIPSSFRDPSGHLFILKGELYRQINITYKDDYDLLTSSGLYTALTEKGLLIPHEEVALPDKPDEAYKCIRPERLPFISYPYEWCFSQWKQAALTTLAIQQCALDFGMWLKDASAYNIQFKGHMPVFIDTLSFEKIRSGEPWVAYRQFCQHFLAPLALMSLKDIRLGQLMRVHMDGIPLDFASHLLPFKTRFSFSLLIHLHLHAKWQDRYGNKAVKKGGKKLSLRELRGITDNLESAIRKLKWRPTGTEWKGYYDETNYSAKSFEQKKEIVSHFLNHTGQGIVWDLGSNTGEFSRITASKERLCISFDIDPACVESNYCEAVRRKERLNLPILIDLTNPSSAIGWAHEERCSLSERGPADTIIALALIHHLALSNNIPLKRIAEFFYEIGQHLIVEFIPKEDSQVQRMLSTREDLFPGYTQAGFEEAFKPFFSIRKRTELMDSTRTLYLMSAKKSEEA